MKRQIMLIMLMFWMLISSLAFSATKKGIKLRELKNNEGKRWAIIIGVDDYQDNGILDLKKAKNDAKALEKVLKNEGQFDIVYTMTDDKDFKSTDYPSYFKIKDKLSYIGKMVRPNDLVVFAFSGHGVTINGESRLVVSDSRLKNMKESTINLEKDVVAMLNKAGVKKSLFLIDACREDFQINKEINKDKFKAKKFEKAEVAATFYATRAGWYSYEDTETDYGVFTRFIVEGLKGNADRTVGNKDGIVSFKDIKEYLVQIKNYKLLLTDEKRIKIFKLKSEHKNKFKKSSFEIYKEIL